VWWLRPLLCCGEYTYDCKLKKFREMSLTTLAHNQHDVIDVIWRFPVWSVKIIRYLASCMLQFWSNLCYVLQNCSLWLFVLVISPYAKFYVVTFCPVTFCPICFVKMQNLTCDFLSCDFSSVTFCLWLFVLWLSVLHSNNSIDHMKIADVPASPS
jgi:hypothetical protein